MLKDSNDLWGIPISTIRTLGKKYRLYQTIIYALDFVMLIFCGVYMFQSGASFNICVTATMCITMISFFLLNVFINPEKWRAFVFYKKYKKSKIEELDLYLLPENMYSILYCTNYKRLKSNCTISEYKEAMLSACCEDSVFSQRLGKLLYRFHEYTDDTEKVTAYFVCKGRKKLLIGFKDED